MTDFDHHHIDARGIRLHVVERGTGPAVIFCHGFPSTWLCWRSAMHAAAQAGFRSIALDMRGYGDSDAPADGDLYTPFETVGDIIALLDRCGVEKAILVGHDFGANIAWNAAMMRPDRVFAVFGVSVPFLQPGGPSFLDQLREAGKTDFYMFRQMAADADRRWADAARSIPASHYWLTGEPSAAERWDPFDPAKDMLRPAPGAAKSIDRAYIEELTATFDRTGFRGGLNYYRSIDRFFRIANRAFAGWVIKQPSFFLTGALDGLNAVRNLGEASLRETMPGLTGAAEIEGVGHWPQLEAEDRFNAILLDFLQTARPLAKEMQ